MSLIADAINLGRPVNMLITAATVFAGGYLLIEPPDVVPLAVAAAGAAFIAGFGNGINDCIDIESDRVNKPNRPIASGRLAVKHGVVVSIVCLLIGLAAALMAGIQCLIIALLAAAILLVYSIALKRVVVISNATVACIAALTFLYAIAVEGEWSWDMAKLAYAGAVFSFLFHFSREILKDIEDIEGDRIADIATLAQIAGASTSIWIALTVYVLLGGVMVIVYFVMNLGITYLTGAVVLSVVTIAVAASALRKDMNPAAIGQAHKRLKLLMPFGLILLLIARITL